MGGNHKSAVAFLILWIGTMATVCCVGCGGQAGFTNISDTPRKGVTDKPSDEIKEQASGLTAFAKAVEVKQDTAITLIQSNAATLARIESKLEASLASPKPQQSGGDPAALQPPAKNANDSQTSTKIVAEPGAVSQSESLVELATRLYAQGVNTHMKTREQLEAIDAQLNGGQPVTGAIFQNNRTSAVTSQRSAVRLIPRGRGVVRWQSNSSAQTCGPGGCPQR